MRKNIQQNFNSFTNIFIIILLFLSGLSYADTNSIWQFANDTRGGTFGGDEQGVTSQYTFINPVYFNVGLVSTGLSTFTDLRTNIFNANSATIATQLTLTGFNCNANSKLRTDSFGNVVCSADNVNDADNVVGNEYPIAGTGITITAPRTVNANDISPTNEIQVLSKIGNTISLSLGGGSVIDSNTDTFITTQTCPVGQVLKSVGKNSKVCVIDAQGIVTEVDPTVPAYVKDGTSWAEVSGKPVGFADNVDNVGITTETDPQVRTVTNGKWCAGVAGGKIDCTSAAPSSGLIKSRAVYSCPANQGCGTCNSQFGFTSTCTAGPISRGKNRAGVWVNHCYNNVNRACTVVGYLVN